MIELLKSGRVDNSLLCELAAHPDFPRLMADLEIYVNGTAVKTGTERKRHCGHHECNDYETAQPRLDRPAVKTAYRRPY